MKCLLQGVAAIVGVAIVAIVVVVVVAVGVAFALSDGLKGSADSSRNSLTMNLSSR